MNEAYTILVDRAKSNYFYNLDNVSNGDCTSFSDFNETQDVVATYVVVGGPWQSSLDPSKWGQGTQMFVAYFTDLELIALLPDATIDGSYVTQRVGDDSPVEMIEASEIRNATRSPINAEVTLSSAWSSTVDGAIQNSEGYNLPEVIRRGESFHFDAEQRFPETYTVADAFENGWKREAAKVLSKDEGYTVTMPLPPCTNVLLKRMNYNNTATTTFDCPVGLKFKVRLATGGDILFNNQRQGLVFGKLAFNSDVLAELKEQTGDKYNDVIGYGETGEAVNAVMGRAPMTILPASFTETVKGESTEYVDTVPTLPLDSVKLVPPSNTTFIMDGEFSYGKLNYMHADMALGESAFTDLLTVKGYNKEGAEYYGFNPSRGGWIVTDKDGKQITGKNAPIELDDATGKYTAVKPGTCYLRYAIDEKTYPDFDPSEDDLAKVFYGEKAWEEKITNRNLSSWAALEITVKGDLYTMNISGSYNGYVNRAPETLNKKDGGLVVSVIDNRSDLQTNEVPYTWQTQELEGIDLEEDGTVSFTEPGEYHVRAINKAEGLVSDWVVIHAYDKAPVTIATAPVAAAITYGQDLSASVLSGGKAFEADTEDAVEGTFTWKNPSVKPNVADSDVTAYEVVFTPVDAEMYEQGSCMVTLTVNPAPAQAVTAPRPRPLVYNGQSQALVNAGKADGGIMWYALADDGDIAPVFDDNNAGGVWSVNPPAGVDAGEYFVWYIVDADANHTDSEAKCVKATINNEPTDPEAPLRGTLVYNGAPQALVKPGSVVGGTLQYYVGETVPENEADWSREVPSAVDAGAYCVWYRVKGDKNHNDTVPTALEVAISPKPLYVKALNASKISGQADPELTYEVTGLVGMDRMHGKLAREAGVVTGVHAGVCTIYAISPNGVRASAQVTVTE